MCFEILGYSSAPVLMSECILGGMEAFAWVEELLFLLGLVVDRGSAGEGRSRALVQSMQSHRFEDLLVFVQVLIICISLLLFLTSC